MNGSILSMLLSVFVAGLVGGALNALITDNGFIFPKADSSENGTRVLRPGFVGNMFTGGIGALVSWGLYTASALVVIGTGTSDVPSLTLGSLAGALLVGVGGARWLSNEVDKSLLRAAAVDAAGKDPSAETAKKLALSTPAGALKIAREM